MVGIDGLGQVVVSARQHSKGPVLLRRHLGQQNEVGVRDVRLDADEPAQHDAGQLGQHPFADDDLGASLLEVLPRLGSGPSDNHLMTQGFDRP